MPHQFQLPPCELSEFQGDLLSRAHAHFFAMRSFSPVSHGLLRYGYGSLGGEGELCRPVSCVQKPPSHPVTNLRTLLLSKLLIQKTSGEPKSALNLTSATARKLFRSSARVCLNSVKHRQKL